MANATPLVSIIVPVYNGERYIGNAYNNANRQTVTDWELLFVNDGSTDSTYDCLKHFCNNDNRVKIINQINSGPGIARNNGLKKANGRYIAFWDVDDYFDNSFLECLLDLSEKHNADISVCAFRERYEDTGAIRSNTVYMKKTYLPLDRSYLTSRECSEGLFQIFGNFIWNKLFRRSFIEKYGIRFADSSYNEDTTFTYLALALADRIAFTHKELMTYLRNKGDSICDNLSERWRDNVYSFSVIERKFKETGIYEEYEKTWLKSVTRMLSLYFRLYNDEEAINGLYEYATGVIKNRLFILNKEDYYEIEDYYRWKALCESRSPVEFIFALKDIKNEKPHISNYKIHRFPYEKVPQLAQLVIYGAGDVGRDLYIQCVESGARNVVAWVDSYPGKYVQKGYKVKSPDVINNIQFDVILVAVLDKKIGSQIKCDLINRGISEKKILLFAEECNKDDLIKELDRRG